MTEKKPSISFFLYLVLLLGALILSLEYIILPLGFAPLSRETYLMGFAARPYAMVEDTPINSMGFAGDDISVDKSPGTMRVLTLGTSSFFDHRLAERLKLSLSTVTGDLVEVLGGALRLHTTMASVYIYRSLSKYQFDYVLICGGSDLWMNNAMDFKDDYSFYDPWYKRNFILDNSIIARRLYNGFYYFRKTLKGAYFYWRNPTKERTYYLSHRSYLNDFFEKLYQTCREDEKVTNGAHFAADRVFERNIRTLVNEVRQHHGVPVLITMAYYIPANYSEKLFDEMRLGYNNPKRYDYCPLSLWGGRAYAEQGTKRFNDIIRKVAREQGVPLIDQQELMGSNQSYFGDAFHLSEEGTDEFIRNVTNFFRQHKFFDTPSNKDLF